jgi:uncharacterized protein YndB with AHSA1/START domain
MKHIPSTTTDFVIEREFAATPEAVFHAWAADHVIDAGMKLRLTG